MCNISLAHTLVIYHIIYKSWLRVCVDQLLRMLKICTDQVLRERLNRDIDYYKKKYGLLYFKNRAGKKGKYYIKQVFVEMH